MIQIKVDVTASMVVSPESWDTVGGLMASVKQAVANALAYAGHDVEVEVGADFA